MGQNQVWRQGPRAGAGGGGPVQAPDQWGWGGLPSVCTLDSSTLPCLTAHIQGLTQEEKHRSSFQNILFWGKKKNSFAVQRPGSKYRINQAHGQVPALLVRALTPGARHVTRVSGASSCCCCGSPEEEAPAPCQTPVPLYRAAAPEAPQTRWGL